VDPDEERSYFIAMLVVTAVLGVVTAVVAVLVAIVPSGDDEPAPAPSRTTTAPPVP